MVDLPNYLQTQRHRIEQWLQQLLPDQLEVSHSLFEGARYALLGGGKYLRPILALATAEALGTDTERLLQPACALELIHSYSMVHDDLPCMDDDDYRRGRPTVHKKFGEGQAVLIGDFLLTYAFELIANAPLLKPTIKLSLIATLAHRSGGEGMIGGQMLDLAAEGKTISQEELALLHKKKTAALITAAVEFGAILSEADVHTMNALSSFGEKIGLAFQIIDDILDLTSSEAKHGRKVASDLTNHKATYATLMGIDQAQKIADHLYLEALDSLKLIPEDTSLLAQLANFIIHRKT